MSLYRGCWGVALAIVGCTANTIDPGDDAAAGNTSTGGLMMTGGGPVTTAPSPTTSTPQPTTAGPVTTVPTSVGTATDSSPDTGWTTDWDDDVATTGPYLDVGGFQDMGVPEISFFGDVAPILQTLCAPGCHEPGGEWPAQDLLNTPYFALVGVPSQAQALNKVEPFSPDESYLWHKINGSHIEVGGAGVMMPKALPGQSPVELTDNQFATIELWILQGAQNN